ncbi:ISL3 family transposase [Photobacterium sp. MCCC 1A19761]|uniref:ISL3 family transposase n=1 Tax=Photobacterium sp. MCCC 1A19761 TaxID=3115000 RepID=UPI00307F886F
MKDTALYEAILGLVSPWSVSSVQLDEPSHRITVTVAYAKDTVQCPTCQKTVRKHDSRKRVWRHLDTCQFETYIEAKIPRCDCPKHGVQTLPVPWASSGSRYTELFEAKIIEALQTTSLLAVAKLFRISWGAIAPIMGRAVSRGLSRRQLDNVEHLLVDETALCRGHDYVTVLSNRAGQVIAVSDGKTAESLAACYAVLPMKAKLQTRSVSMDMSRAFINATEAYFGHRAKQIISIDHFHIAKLLTKAVDDVRKQDAESFPSSMKRECHRTRYGWLKRNDRLNKQLRVLICELSKIMVNTGLSWVFNEQASRIKPMINAANTVKAHLPRILNAMRMRVSYGLAEAINAQIQYIKLCARGYRNKSRFKMAILFHFGQLDMAFHHKR